MITAPIPAPATASVSIDGDSFWGARRRTNRLVTIPSQLRQMRDTGRLSPLSGDWTGERHPFWDSDIAKWLEAACEELVSGGDDRDLRAAAVEIMEAFARTQDADGYLGSWHRLRPEARYRNLRDEHEIYTVGHLLEAFCAYADAGLGDIGLAVARRSLDHLWREFGPDGRPGYCGHPEIEMALMRLWRLDGDPRARALAQLMVDRRGVSPHLFDAEARARGEDPATGWPLSYFQAHAPLREQRDAVGHAVRALYLFCGMADLAAAGDASVVPALRALWDSSVHRRMYITGGMGSTKEGEAYTTDFDLPDDTAYCETCAAIALARWASRMLLLDLRGEYGDVMERALHNCLLAGIGLDGESYFYSNPLAVSATSRRGSEEHVQPARRSWFGCACCPPNVARTLSQLGAFAYAASDDRLAVHLYLPGEARLTVAGVALRLRIETQLPWEGTVRILVEPERATTCTIALRMPAWCRAPRVRVNAVEVSDDARDGYLSITRAWQAGDVITLELPMQARRVHAHPAVRSAAGKVAIERGPLVYCVEQADAGGELDDLSLPDDAEFQVERSDLLGGCAVITAQALRTVASAWNGPLYRDAAADRGPAQVVAVPYCLWGNRGAGDMRVWLRRG